MEQTLESTVVASTPKKKKRKKQAQHTTHAVPGDLFSNTNIVLIYKQCYAVLKIDIFLNNVKHNL